MWVKLPKLAIEVEVMPRVGHDDKSRLYVTAWRGKDGKIYDNVLKVLTKGAYPGMEAVVEMACKLCEIAMPVIQPNAFDLGTPQPKERPKLAPRGTATSERPRLETHTRPKLKPRKIVRKQG